MIVASNVEGQADKLSGQLILLTCLGGAFSAGGASAINHYLDRHLDAQMERTARRPVPAGRIHPAAALSFGITLGIASFVLLATTVNLLAASLALCGLLGYVFIYTMWLKMRTPQNIVIGGAAGAVPPLVGWAAVTGSLSLTAWMMFAIIFIWTPPHFWALSLLIKDDYARSSVPMLPVVRGEAYTKRQIMLYSLVLIPVTLVPVLTGAFGALYAATAVVLGITFFAMTVNLRRSDERRKALHVYLYSLAYLAILFVAMAVDSSI